MATTSPSLLLYEVERTDVLLAAVTRELERHREELDADPDLRSVVIRVAMNRASGLPRAVILTRESEHDYARE